MNTNGEIEKLIKEGFSYVDAGDLEKADEIFARVLNQAPADLTASYGRAWVLRQMRRYPEAQGVLDQVLLVNRNNVRLLLEQGQLFYAQSIFDKAVEALEKVLNQEKENVEALQLKIAALRLQGRAGQGEKLAEAQKLVDQAVTQFSANPEILTEYGWVHYDLKEYDEAFEAFIKSGDQHGAQAVVGKLRSERLFEEAEKFLKQGLDRFPASALILNERAALYYDRGQYDQAIETFDKVLNLEKDNRFAFRLKLSALRSQGRAGQTEKLAEAETLADQAVTQFFDNPKILAECGRVYYDLEKYDKAFEAFIKSGDQNGSQRVIGRLRSERRFEEAERFLKQGLERFPASVLILNERGTLFVDQGQYDKAVEAFDNVLSIEGDNRFAFRLKLSALRLLARTGQTEKLTEAQGLIASAPEELSKDPDILIEWGWIHYDLNDYNKAFETFLSADNEYGRSYAVLLLRVRGRYGKGEQLVEESLKKFPRSTVLLGEWVTLCLQLGNYDKAIQVCDRALEVDPQDISILPQKILALRLLGRQLGSDKLNEAEKLADETLVRFPGEGRILIERGWIYWDQDQFAQADKNFALVAGLDQAKVDIALLINATFGRVEALRKMNRSAEAAEILEKVCKSVPGDPYVTSQLGWLYLQRYDYINAKKTFEGISEKVNDGIIRYNGLGALYFGQRNYEEAEVCIRRVLAAAPDDPTSHNNLAWTLVRQGRGEGADLDEAERECLKAIEINPNYSSPYGCRGIIAFKRGRLRDSEEFFRDSIRVNEKEGNYTDLGALYVQMGRYKEAAEQLKKALALNSDDAQAHIELGNLYLQTGKIKRSVAEFRQAMAIDANNEDAPRALAIALMRAGDVAEAEKVLRNAIKRLDEDKRWRLHLMLCQLLTKSGDNTDDRQLYEEALKEVNKAISLEPEEADPYFYKGVVRFKLEDYYRAWKNFHDCLDKNEDHYEAERNARLVRSLIVKEKGIQLGSIIGAFLLGVVSVGQLVVIWVLYLSNNRVSEKMVIIMIPILLGLFVVAFLLPGLVRLKLPGLEAELSQPKQKESISSGPKGEIGAGSSPAVSSGPR